MANKQPAPKASFGGAILGGMIALVGVAVALEVYSHPEGLKAPLWVALVACSTLPLSGLALWLKATRFNRVYHWTVVAIVLCMGSIAAWLTFGRDAGACTSNIPLIGSPFACRVAFGASTVFALLILALAIKDAIRRPAA